MIEAAADTACGRHSRHFRKAVTGRSLMILLAFLMGAAVGAAEWQALGPEGGIVTAVASSPSNADVLYAVLNTGAHCRLAEGCRLVYRSGDGGESWQRRGAFLYEPEALRIDPQNPNKLFVATYGGLYRSLDGGGTWQLYSLDDQRVTDVAINPLNPQTVFASTLVQNSSEGGIYRSVDGGDSWQRLVTTPVEYWFRALAVDPVNAGWLYVWAGDELYRSTDAGNTWSAPLSTLSFVETLLIDPGTPSTLYTVNNADGVSKSLDGGVTWLPANSGLSGGDLEIWMEPQAPSVLYASSSDGFFRSLDGGGQWSEEGAGPGAGVLDVVPAIGASGTLFAGSSAGLFKSSDGGATWDKQSRGMRHSQVKAFARHPTDPSTVYAVTTYGGAGHRFAGLQVSHDGGHSWQGTSLDALPTIGDASMRFSPSDPDRLWVSMAYHGVWQSQNGGTDWALYTQGLSGFGEPLQFTRLAVDPADSDRLFLGSSWIGDGTAYRSSDGGFEWLGSDLNRSVYDFAIDSPRSIIYAATNSGAYESLDGGVTFERVLDGFSVGFAASVAFHPDLPDTVYWGQSDRMYSTSDGGLTYEQRTIGTDGDRVVSLLVDPASPSTIYAAVDEGGVAMSTDSGLTWQLLVDGLDAGGIIEMQFDPLSSRVLWLATDHYGLYRLALDEFFVDGFETGDTSLWDLTVSD